MADNRSGRTAFDGCVSAKKKNNNKNNIIIKKNNKKGKVYLTIRVGESSAAPGTVRFVLYDDDVPRTCRDFRALIEKGYAGTRFHRVIRNFMAQGGRIPGDDRRSPDENFSHRHSARGVLSMANTGPNTNGTEFFVTLRATPHLDGKHVVFGRVDPDCAESRRTLDALERVTTDENDAPTSPVEIVECGALPPPRPTTTTTTTAMADDEDEIDLDEDDENVEETNDDDEKDRHRAEDEAAAPLDDDPSTDTAASIGGGNSLRQRLARLRMRMNQSKVLNRREVLKEGERLTSEEGKQKERKRIAKLDKERRSKEWEAVHGKVRGSTAGKAHMVESASDNLKRTARKEAVAEANRYEVNDYHNPEGQHRNYERNLKSIVRDSRPGANDAASEALGARRLADELRRRGEKAAKRQLRKRTAAEFEATDVDYVDQRNKRFNEKIGRTYDKYTAEIRQNLERGTAL